MNETSSLFADRPDESDQCRDAAGCADRVLTRRWEALGEAGSAVAAMAGRTAAPPQQQTYDFAARIRGVAGMRRTLVESAIGDIDAMMRPGLRALLTTIERGQDSAIAAETLWREFDAACNSVLTILPPIGNGAHPDS